MDPITAICICILVPLTAFIVWANVSMRREMKGMSRAERQSFLEQADYDMRPW